VDQLQMAGIDPRRGLAGPEQEQLLREEQALLRRLARLRADALLVPEEAWKGEAAQKLLADFEQAQQRYAEVSRDILNASPVYRHLAQPDFAATLRAVRDRVLGPNRLLLVYHIGRRRSHL